MTTRSTRGGSPARPRSPTSAQPATVPARRSVAVELIVNAWAAGVLLTGLLLLALVLFAPATEAYDRLRGLIASVTGSGSP